MLYILLVASFDPLLPAFSTLTNLHFILRLLYDAAASVLMFSSKTVGEFLYQEKNGKDSPSWFDKEYCKKGVFEL